MCTAGIDALVDYWVAERPLPGQTESGDKYLVAPYPGGVLAAVVDGLGHGAEACEAARLAIETLAGHAEEPVTLLMQRCHETLRPTRGAVVTLASLHAQAQTLTWLAVGNVEAVLRRKDLRTAKPVVILPRGGIVGARLPPLNPATLPLSSGDLLLLATDGIGSLFMRDVGKLEQPRQLVNHIFAQHAKSTDDALILGVQWINGSRARKYGSP